MEAKRVLSHEAHPLPSQSEVAGATILIGFSPFFKLSPVKLLPPSAFSLVTQRPIILERILGKIEQSSGKVTKAKAVQSTYFLKNQEVYSQKTGQNVRRRPFLFLPSFIHKVKM